MSDERRKAIEEIQSELERQPVEYYQACMLYEARRQTAYLQELALTNGFTVEDYQTGKAGTRRDRRAR